MKRRHVLATMGTLAASGSLVIGSGAFSSVETQREITVDVVGDPEAYLGLQYPTEGGEPIPQPVRTKPGERTDLFIGTNQFTATITSFVTEIVDGVDDFDDISLHVRQEETDCIVPEEERFGVGECVQVMVDCDHDGTTAEIEVRIRAEGDTFEVTAERVFEVTCEPLDLGDLTGIGFVAFCTGGDGPPEIQDIEVLEENDDGDPVEIGWESDVPIAEVVLFGGNEWYLFQPEGATEGTAIMSADADTFGDDRAADEFVERDPPNGITFEVDEEREGDYVRCGSSPCYGEQGTKLEAEYDFSSITGTNAECPESQP